MKEATATIKPSQYYSAKKLRTLSPFLSSRGYLWLLTCIKRGQLKAVNTSGNPLEPRYSIKGQDALDFLKSMGVS